jgi:hypothetical protein
MTEYEDGGYPTLAEVAQRCDPDGSTPYMVNVLEKKSALLRDLPAMEGNLPTGHQIIHTATSLPEPTFRNINEGVLATKGKTQRYTESCALIEDHSIVDEALVELNGGMAWRESEDMIKLGAFPQFLETEFFYESVSTNPNRFHGMTPRYPATTGYTSSGYVKAGTNAGTNAHSIWLITPAPRKVYMIYPKGTKAGLERTDLGKQVITDSSSKRFVAYLTQFKWKIGLAVEDYRYCVRFQWDPDDPEMAASEKGLYLGVMDLFDIIYENTPNTRLYMNRTSIRRLNAQLLANESRPLQFMNIQKGKIFGDPAAQGGERVREFNNCAIRVTDGLVAETAIS